MPAERWEGGKKANCNWKRKEDQGTRWPGENPPRRCFPESMERREVPTPNKGVQNQRMDIGKKELSRQKGVSRKEGRDALGPLDRKGH